MKHHIRQQIFDVEFNGPESEAMRLQHRFSDWNHSSLMPLLEWVLDRCVPADRQLCLDKLVIEVEKVQIENWENELPRRIVEALEKAINEQLREAKSGQKSNAHLKNQPQLTAEAFAYFLQTGLLPWAYRVPKGESWEEVVRQAVVREPVVFKQIMLELPAHDAVRQRLVNQFSETFLSKLFSLLNPQKALEIERLTKLLREIAAENAVSALIHPVVKQLWLWIWQQMSAGKKIDLLRIMEKLSKEMTPPEQQLLKETGHRWTKKNPDSLSWVQSDPKSEPFIEKAPKQLPLQTPDEIYIENAGLILLHPFLPRYFEGILCVADDQLVWAEKAASALHFLATGQPEAAEYELTMAKILCGIPLLHTLPTRTDWSDSDTEESEALLNAVIGYWPALKDSSIGLLRAEFLQRAGKFSRRGDDWLLQVEKKEFDFLLEQIPWSISAIKLPWMQQMLWVEWT